MSTRLLRPLAAAALLALLGSGARAVAPLQAATIVKTAPAHILVNARGMTLYIFTHDKANKSACTGACAAYWPALTLPKGAAAPSLPGVGGTFGVATRPDGARQLTYDGAPLYTFAGDKKPGDMNGQGLQGGAWWVVVANTPAQHAQPAATPAPSPTAATMTEDTATPTAPASAATPPAPSPTPSSGGYGGHGGY